MKNLLRIGRAFILLFGMMILTSCCLITPSLCVKASCIVGESLVTIKIPITLDEPYSWNDDSTNLNYLEFECSVTLQSYELGYYHFKFQNNPQTGTIDELLNAGQVNIWEITESGASYVQGHTVSLEFNTPYIEFTITDPSTITMLFGDSPTICSFKLQGFEADSMSGSIDIQYK